MGREADCDRRGVVRMTTTNQRRDVSHPRRVLAGRAVAELLRSRPSVGVSASTWLWRRADLWTEIAETTTDDVIRVEAAALAAIDRTHALMLGHPGGGE